MFSHADVKHDWSKLLRRGMKNFKELCVNDDVLDSVWCRCGP